MGGKGGEGRVAHRCHFFFRVVLLINAVTKAA